MGLSVSHAITRSVRDSALLLDISAGPEAGSRVTPSTLYPSASSYLAALSTPPQPLRIALVESNPFGLPLDPACKAATARAAALCEQLGHHVEIAAPALPVIDLMGALGILSGTGNLVSIRDRERVLGRAVTADDLEPIIWQSYQSAQKYTAEQIYRARALADKGGQILDEFLTHYDLILSPVTAAPPPLIGALALDQPYERYAQNAIVASCFTAMYNLSGLPAMSVPLYMTQRDMTSKDMTQKENLPIGSMFAGRFGDELTLLRLAAQLEQIAPWSDRRPSI
jgi:Asp-tRNA(Asn)/Glu-tRNA(Gln) amidotransferase A subunit family amidase